MVKQHASPKVPLRPRSGNEDGGAAAGTPRRTVELPFDESWFEDGLSPARGNLSYSQALQSPSPSPGPSPSQSQSQSPNPNTSQSQSQSQSQNQSQSQTRNQADDLLDRFDALRIRSTDANQDDSVVEIAPPAPAPAPRQPTYPTPRPGPLFGTKDKKWRPMSSAQQKAVNSVFVQPRTRPEHHRSRPPPKNSADDAFRVTGPKNPIFADVKPDVKMYSSRDVFGSTTNKGYTPIGGYGGEEFYTDPKKASEDLKALLEGGMDEHEDEKPEESANDGTLEGLDVKLLPHQVEGVEWMKGRELGPVKRGKVPRGGILADDMGLGKTLQSISLILSNQRPEKGDKAWKKNYEDVSRTTLVVAPLALIRQWEAEVKEKVARSHSMRVYVHHGPGRTKSSKELSSYDVVVTTYQTLVSEHGTSSSSEGGPKSACYGLHWWRVILDEAHTIKNRNAKATKACCGLRSVFRWCLTGTPMQNNLDELQSLIHFLRIQPYDDLREWRDQIDKPMKGGRGHLALRRLHSLLRCFMKRRTKEILKEEGALNPGGKPSKAGESSGPGFKVTERKVVAIAAEFSAEEKRFYDRVQQRADKTLEKMLRGKVNYANALVLLLRLRQVCNHPKLVEGKVEKEADALGSVSAKGGSQISDAAVDDLADMLAGASIETKNCSICGYELTGEEARLGGERCKDCFADLEYFNNHGGDKRATKDKERRERRAEKEKRREERRARVKAEAKSVPAPEPASAPAPEPEHESEPEDSFRSAKLKRRNRNIIVDSDDEDEEEEAGSWLVPEGQRGSLHLGKAGGSEDENCEGGGDWIGSEDSLHADETEDGSALDSFVVPDEKPGRDQKEDNEFPSLHELCSQPLAADESGITADTSGVTEDDSALTADDTTGVEGDVSAVSADEKSRVAEVSHVSADDTSGLTEDDSAVTADETSGVTDDSAVSADTTGAGENDDSAVTAADTTGATDDASDTEMDTDSDSDTSTDTPHTPQVVASAKIRELNRILDDEARQHKFIVFSQFTTMLDLVEPFLQSAGLKFSRYDGSMRNDEREESLRMLRGDAETRVLLCSLKCGSLGLNLTAATRVVILEPFWNPVSFLPSPYSILLRNGVADKRNSSSRSRPSTASTASRKRRTSSSTSSPSRRRSRSASSSFRRRSGCWRSRPSAAA